jgi:cytochrome c oxidase subunit 1
VIFVLATPVLAVTLMMVALERIFQAGIFSSALGGDPVLFQHLFGFYSHPALYIMICRVSRSARWKGGAMAEGTATT